MHQDPLNRKETKSKGEATGAEQTARKLSRETPVCFPCQLLPPAQAEPRVPRDVPALACRTLQLCPSTSAFQPNPRRDALPSLALRCCSPGTRCPSAGEISKRSFAFDAESRLSALRSRPKRPSAGPCPSQWKRKVKSQQRQGKLIFGWVPLCPRLDPGLPAKTRFLSLPLDMNCNKD